MSVEYNIYVGPVVRCKFTPVERKYRVGRGCERHPAFTFTDSTKFCTECGAVTIWKMRSEMRAPMDSLSDLDDVGFMAVHAQDGKYPANEHVYWVNMMDGAPRQFHLDDVPEHFEPLSVTTRHSDMAWMEDKFAADIEKMRALYGSENVTLDWGVFRWTS